MYTAKSLRNKLLMKIYLYCVKIEESAYLKSDLNPFTRLCNELQNLEVKTNGKDKTILLLKSFRLCSKFENYSICGKEDVHRRTK